MNNKTTLEGIDEDGLGGPKRIWKIVCTQSRL